MKKIAGILLFGTFLMWGTFAANAQNPNSEEKKKHLLNEEEEGPLMFKFEPDFLSSVEKRKEEIIQTRAILDTMDISERKRKRLLKELYKKGVSKRLSKVLYAETKFEDADDVDN